MNRITFILYAGFVVILTGFSSPAKCSGLIGNLVDIMPLGHGFGAQAGKFKPNSSALDNPSTLSPKAPVVTVEYTGDNILRRRTNGALTGDMTLSGASETIFVPIRWRTEETVIALSQTSSKANLFYDDPEVGGHLLWDFGSSGWAINQTIGKLKLGAAAGKYSGMADGSSIYPQYVFHIFSGSTPTVFNVSGTGVRYQMEYPISRNSTVRFTRGSAESNYDMGFKNPTSKLSIPMDIDSALNGFALDKKLSKKAYGSINYLKSNGDGSDHILLNSLQVGRLDSRTHSSAFDGYLDYETRKGNHWRIGKSSIERVLDLRGAGIRGKSLGINLQPFNEKIDFDGRINVLDSVYYLGTERRISDKWQFSAYYKRATLKSYVNVDYAARGFLGLLAVYGSTAYAPFILRGQGIDLAATYTRGPFSMSLQIEQLLPIKAESGGAPSPSLPGSKPKDEVKTLGGTSFSLSCSYGY